MALTSKKKAKRILKKAACLYGAILGSLLFPSVCRAGTLQDEIRSMALWLIVLLVIPFFIILHYLRNHKPAGKDTGDTNNNSNSGGQND